MHGSRAVSSNANHVVSAEISRYVTWRYARMLHIIARILSLAYNRSHIISRSPNDSLKYHVIIKYQFEELNANPF